MPARGWRVIDGIQYSPEEVAELQRQGYEIPPNPRRVKPTATPKKRSRSPGVRRRLKLPPEDESEGSQEEDSPWSHVGNPDEEAESPYTGHELDHPIAAPYAGEKVSESPSPDHPPCLWPVPVRDQRRLKAPARVTGGNKRPRTGAPPTRAKGRGWWKAVPKLPGAGRAVGGAWIVAALGVFFGLSSTRLVTETARVLGAIADVSQGVSRSAVNTLDAGSNLTHLAATVIASAASNSLDLLSET